MPTPALPQEVLDQVVDNFGRKPGCDAPNPSFKTLKALALASRCFLDRSYSHLFEEVHFDSYGYRKEKSREKLKVFASRLELCKHIRLYRAETQLDLREGDADDPELLGIHSSMLEIARNSNGVREVHIGSPVGSGFPFKWVSIGPLVREAVEILFTNSLTSIHLVGTLDFPIQLLANLTTPHRLSLTGTTSLSNQRQPQPLSRLKSFTHRSFITGQDIEVALFSSVLLSSSLVDLDLNILGMDRHRAAWSTILSTQARPETLQSLRLRYSLEIAYAAREDLVDSDKSLPGFPHLRSLSIDTWDDCVTFDSDTNAGLMIPSRLPQLLHTILKHHVQPSLETLSAPMRFTRIAGIPPVATRLSQTIDSHLSGQWALLDDILSDASMFPSMRVVAFPMRYYRVGDMWYGKKMESALIEEINRTLQSSLSRQLFGSFSKTTQRLQGIDVTVSDNYSEEVAFFG